MKIELNVPEVVSLFKEIQCQSEKIFEMLRLNVQEMVGRYLGEVMSAELTKFFWAKTLRVQRG
jgi:putative transposase